MSYSRRMDGPQDPEWLLEHLAELVHHRGQQTFCTTPIIEPTPEFFPDRWHRDIASVRRLLQRLLRFAGMENVRIGVEFDRNVGAPPAFDASGQIVGRHYSHRDAAAWFVSASDDYFLFGVDMARLDRPDDLLGVLCHEVAHAYRSRHGLEYRSRRDEEPLTDLTTVYLGLGVPLLRSARPSRPDPDVPEYERVEYLQPRWLAFLLAAQVVTREDARLQKRIARFLPPNPKSDFNSACASFRSGRETLLSRLKIDPAAIPPPSQHAFNRGLPVFRVRGKWPFSAARCSDPDCRAKQPKNATTCPGCGGTIAQDVDSPEEAVAREESLLGLHTDVSDDLSRLLKRREDG